MEKKNWENKKIQINGWESETVFKLQEKFETNYFFQDWEFIKNQKDKTPSICLFLTFTLHLAHLWY